MSFRSLRRVAKRWHRVYRDSRMVALALASPRHPVLAHIVAIRRCNLSCTYCNEFDNFSKPVPASEMLHRIDLLAALGTTAITVTGGEPLLHPELEEIISRIRRHGIMAVLVTNGYLLTPERIERLNRAGLDRMQISVDNIQPDATSKKSLKVLDQKLHWLSQFAEFQVSIHSVVGASIKNPQDALAIARRAHELGLASTAGIVHDDSGQLRPLSAEQQNVLDEIENLSRSPFSFALRNPWRKNLSRAQPNDWHCTAGGRHLYICEDGLVHYCLAQRGRPAIPLAQYTRDDIEREAKVPKGCAPYCTIFCVQRVAFLDKLRSNPRQALEQFFPQPSQGGRGARFPIPVRVIRALLLPSGANRNGQFFRKVALRIFGISS